MAEMIFDGMIDWEGHEGSPITPGLLIKPRVEVLNGWMRQVRGGVLTGVFTVETYLNTAITLFILGPRTDDSEVLNVFKESLLDPLTFERRSNVIGLIAPQILSEEEARKLKSDLSEIRTIRNAMAHNSCWFRPELNEKGEVHDMMPMIMRGKAAIPVTQALVEDLNSKIRSLIDRSKDLAEKTEHLRS